MGQTSGRRGLPAVPGQIGPPRRRRARHRRDHRHDRVHRRAHRRYRRAGHRQQVWLSVAGLVLALVRCDRLLAVRRPAGAALRPYIPGQVNWRNPVACCPIRMSSLRGVRVGRVESLHDHTRRCEPTPRSHRAGEDSGVEPRARLRRCHRPASNTSTSSGIRLPGRICTTAA